MIRLFASLLVAFTLFFAPVAMELGGGMAMASSSMTEMNGSCGGMDHSSPDDQKSDVQMNCAAACAAIPGTQAGVPRQATLPQLADLPMAAQVLTGIRLERETPPPRVPTEI